MDTMDIKIYFMRELRKKWPQMFILSALLGCISVVTVVVAGTLMDISFFSIMKRMCIIFISITFFSLCLFAVTFPFLKNIEKIPKPKKVNSIDEKNSLIDKGMVGTQKKEPEEAVANASNAESDEMDTQN